MIEEVFKFGESRLDPTLESCLNLQANHNEGVARRLTDVEFILAEVTVRQEEERDGRLNEKYVISFQRDKRRKNYFYSALNDERSFL